MENNYQLYNNSQQHCHFFKQSLFTTCSIQLMNTSSPTDLMPMLLQQQPQPWKLRTRDMAVQEILRERREAIETGKLKGRRLFEPIQRGTTILNDDVLSGDDMGQESEVRSLSFDYSEDEDYSPPPPSSSSLVRLSCDSLDKEQEVKEEEEEAPDVCNVSGNGGRYIILLGVISIALLIFAVYKSWVRRFEERAVILVPT